LDSDTVNRYAVTISAIHPDATSNKCFTVTVTDPTLIAKTGGIIQGMSGSPIIQDGKLVGAVTHVLVNDPTRGYGIFIENMLGQMEKANQ
jgi:stage IV sporulation protein B